MQRREESPGYRDEWTSGTRTTPIAIPGNTTVTPEAPIRRRTTRIALWLDALRVHQWTKNTLVFVPLLTSHQFSGTHVLASILAFLAFSFCASAIYLLNDVVDVDADRAHPDKRNRALASGRLSMTATLIAIPILLVSAASVALVVSPSFALVMLAYVALTTAYSCGLKRLVMVDIMMLACFYTLRIVSGAVAIDVVLSQWLLVFSIFIFTSLALVKRYAELATLAAAGLPDPINRDYGIGDRQLIGALAAASGLNAVTVFALFLSSPAVVDVYSRPALLWMLAPLLIYWLARGLIMANRCQMHHDPVVFTFSDRPSRVSALLMVDIVLAAI